MEPTSAQGWKWYLGVTFFVYSFVTFGIAALAPLLFSAAVAATIATSVLISGEIGFLLSVALLGKPFVAGLKARLTGFFTAKTEEEQSKDGAPLASRTG